VFFSGFFGKYWPCLTTHHLWSEVSKKMKPEPLAFAVLRAMNERTCCFMQSGGLFRQQSYLERSNTCSITVGG